MHSSFAEFSILLIIAAIAGLVATRLKQPVIISYILVGIIVGPVGFALIQAHDQIELLAKIGVTVLLFLVGLKLDIKHIRHIGPVALATGLGQLLFTIVIGFILIVLLGKDWLTALYVAIALTFSSTIIVIKLLSDKGELDSLHGRIAVGFLIVQDIAVVLAMMFVSALKDSSAEDASWLVDVFYIFVRLAGATLSVYLLMRYILPWVMRYIAQSQELLLIFAIAWGSALATLGELVGFSMEAGAFVAGFSLASTMYREAISARLSGIRDFLLLFFFVELGSKLNFSALSEELFSSLVLSLFVLIGNPLIVMAIMGYMGYRKRTGFMAGLTVAQISEFSIIFVAMGITLGHIGEDALGLTTLVGIITIAMSTYMIIYAQPLYQRLAPWLGIFERKTAFRERQEGVVLADHTHKPPQVWVFGLGRFGKHVMRQLHSQGVVVAGVDFDPETIRILNEQGYTAYYGDTGDPEFLTSLPLQDSRWLITALPSQESNAAWLHGLTHTQHHAHIMALVRTETMKLHMEALGIAHTINPFLYAADHTTQLIIKDINEQGSPS